MNAEGWVTVPNSIRDAIGLQPGDVFGWELDKKSVCIRLISSVDLNCLRGVEANLSEWSTDVDEAAFAGL